MDAQLKRGLLDVCVLASLYKKDSYGYNIIKELSEFIEISESTLYPILKRLESASFLVVYSMEYNGRLRKYYKITPSGKARVREFLDDWSTVMSVFNFIKEAQSDD